MTALLASVLLVGIGMIILLYYKSTDEMEDFKNKDKEQLPVENHEVEKPKIHKKPYKRKIQAKKK